jgi:hypothetical protein
MTNRHKKALRQYAEEIANWYSNKERDHNYAGETYQISRIKPLSDAHALVYYKKEPSEKVSLAHFVLIEKKDRWIYYFLNQGHMINLHMIPDEHQKVEQYNFDR